MKISMHFSEWLSNIQLWFVSFICCLAGTGQGTLFQNGLLRRSRLYGYAQSHPAGH